MGVETCTTVLADWRPGFRRYKAVITLGFCIVCYLMGLAHVTKVSLKRKTMLCPWQIFRHGLYYISKLHCFRGFHWKHCQFFLIRNVISTRVTRIVHIFFQPVIKVRLGFNASINPRLTALQ